MTEALLHYIWKFQLFNKNNLQTEQGEQLMILSQGQYNTNQGPDFLNGKIIIGQTTLVGNIELHIQSSDWLAHQHQQDENYSNVILHVVWQNHQDIKDKYNNALPTLSLQNLVPKVLLQRYKELMESQQFVPCENYLPVLSDIGWLAWKERLAIERLQRKTTSVLHLLGEANNHWEEVFWWLLARNFGIKVNADLFEAIAKTLPVNVLGRHKNQIHQLEGLLLGQAGLLNEKFKEDYPKLLRREYDFLQKKYQLKQASVKPHFLRMRPANFPTIRLAQLAMLIHSSSHLFSQVKETNDLQLLKERLAITANDYWNYHYLLDEPGDFYPKQLGKQMVENIIINTVVPVLFAYGYHQKNDAFKEKSLAWLQQLMPEKNSITNKWTSFSVTNKNALESQALIELKNNYCNEKRCLQCSVGNALLKK